MPVELALKEKLKIIELLDHGVSSTVILEQFKISRSTLCRIRRNRDDLTNVAKQNGNLNLKRMKLSDKSAKLDQKIIEWYREARNRNLPITGPLIQEKALIAAQNLGIENFKASNGWLYSFQLRHGIQQKYVHDVYDSSPIADVQWKDNVSNFISRYDVGDIFNCDECGLLWRSVPSSNLLRKNNISKENLSNKNRLTLLFGVSALGEKLSIAVVAVKSLRLPKEFSFDQLQLYHQDKAFMTNEIFENYLESLNLRMMKEDRKILLLLDSCHCHHPQGSYSHIELLFLPPNTSIASQPLNCGIITSFKAHYRHYLLESLLPNMSSMDVSNDIIRSIDLQQALPCIIQAWDQVSIRTITNCFSHCGILSSTPSTMASLVDNYQEALVDDVIAFKENHWRSIMDVFHIDEFIWDEGDVPVMDRLEQHWEEKILQVGNSSSDAIHHDSNSNNNNNNSNNNNDNDNDNDRNTSSNNTTKKKNEDAASYNLSKGALIFQRENQPTSSMASYDQDPLSLTSPQNVSDLRNMATLMHSSVIHGNSSDEGEDDDEVEHTTTTLLGFNGCRSNDDDETKALLLPQKRLTSPPPPLSSQITFEDAIHGLDIFRHFCQQHHVSLSRMESMLNEAILQLWEQQHSSHNNPS